MYAYIRFSLEDITYEISGIFIFILIFLIKLYFNFKSLNRY